MAYDRKVNAAYLDPHAPHDHQSNGDEIVVDSSDIDYVASVDRKPPAVKRQDQLSVRVSAETFVDVPVTEVMGIRDDADVHPDDDSVENIIKAEAKLLDPGHQSIKGSIKCR